MGLPAPACSFQRGLEGRDQSKNLIHPSHLYLLLLLFNVKLHFDLCLDLKESRRRGSEEGSRNFGELELPSIGSLVALSRVMIVFTSKSIQHTPVTSFTSDESDLSADGGLRVRQRRAGRKVSSLGWLSSR